MPKQLAFVAALALPARRDHRQGGAPPADADASDFLSVDALKLVQPVDVAFRLE
jgi:hypothetical protein